MIILLQTGITQSYLIFIFAGDVNSVEVYFESGSESNDKIEVQQCSTLFSFVTF